MSAVLPQSLLAEKPDINEEVADGYNEVVVLKNTPVAGHTMIARTAWCTEVLEFDDASVNQLSIAEMVAIVDHFLSQIAS